MGQQQPTDKSIVDGYIAQDSFKIAVETKLTPHFSLDQLERHLTVFSQEDHRLLILLAPTRPTETDEWAAFRRLAQGKQVSVLSTTFERIIEVMREVLSVNDEEMNTLVNDFEAFCAESESRLLPNDRYMLFTPPCGPFHADNDLLHFYYCPSERPVRQAHFPESMPTAESLRSAESQKSWSARIDHAAAKVTTFNHSPLDASEQARVLKAAELAPNHGWNITTGHRFYLCDEWQTTNYCKTSPGGIMGARMLDLRKAFPSAWPATLVDVAQGLAKSSWA